VSTRFFSDEEIKRLRSWPGELGRNELIRYFTLGSDDRDWLSRAARGVGNRLGLAVQMCTLPWLGFVPDDVADAPAAAVNRLAVQLGRRPHFLRRGARPPQRLIVAFIDEQRSPDGSDRPG
jgi:hypothetical protein